MDPKNQQNKPSLRKLTSSEQQRAIDDDIRLFQRALDSFPDNASKKILTEGSKEQAKILLSNKGFTSPEEVLNARGPWTQLRDTPTENPHKTPSHIEKPDKPSKHTPGVGDTAAGIGLAAAAPFTLLNRHQTYDGFQKDLVKSSTAIAIHWEEQNEEYQKLLKKDPNAERPYGMAETREQQVENHLSQTLDTYTRINNKRVRKWTEEHPEDLRMIDAVDRIEIERKDLTQEEFEKVRERYTERSTKKIESGDNLEKISEAGKKMERASREMNDRLVQADEKKAKKWAREKNDKGLYEAIERKRQADIAYAKKHQSRISKLLRRDPAKKFKYFGPETNIASVPKPTVSTPRPIASTPSPPPAPHPASQPPSTFTRSIRTTGRRPPTSVAKGGRRRGAGAIGKGAKTAAKRAGKRLAARLAMMPHFWIGVLIVIIVIAIIFFIAWLYFEACNLARQFPFGTTIVSAFGLECDNSTEADFPFPPPPPGFTIVKTAIGSAADGTISNDEPIEYQIIIEYDPNEATALLENLIFWDVPAFPHETPSLVSPGGYEVSGRAYGWNLSNIFDQGNTSIQNQTFNLTLKPNVIDETIINYARIDVVGAGGDPLLGQDLGPSSNDCEGTLYNDQGYTIVRPALENAFGTDFNFGDPACSFSPSNLREVLGTVIARDKVIEGYADFYIDIARCEVPASAGPNFYRDASPDEFGLFRLGSTTPPFQDYRPALDGVGIRGDVTWQNQAIEAVNHNNINGGDFSAWNRSASCLCGHAPWRLESYCERFYVDGDTEERREELRGRCTVRCQNVAQDP